MKTRLGRRLRDQRGVAIVEFSFIALFMVAIVAGAIDFGRGWHSGMAITEAARTGVRVGSGQGKNPAADYYALTGVKASLDTAGKLDDVEKVVVYDAEDGGEVPETCLRANPTGTCNVLTGDQFRNLDKGSFVLTFYSNGDPPTGSGCLRTGSLYSRRSAWCPGHRSNLQKTADFYGIYIEYRQNNLFPISGGDRTISRHAVMRIEPVLDLD